MTTACILSVRPSFCQSLSLHALCCLAPTFPRLSRTNSTRAEKRFSRVWPLTPLSFCRCTPSPSLLKRLQDMGPGGEATGRHAPSLDTTPAVHEPLRPLIFHRCFPSHLQPHRTTVSACTCYPRAATHALFWATTSLGPCFCCFLSMGLQPCACRRPARRARPDQPACSHVCMRQVYR